jgi:hypothetical protein
LISKQPIEVIFPPDIGAEIGGASIIKGGGNPEGAKADVKARGVAMNTIDTKPFQEKVQPVYDKFSGEFGANLIKSVRNANCRSPGWRSSSSAAQTR